MRNIQHTAISSDEGLTLAGKWLHEKIDDGNGNQVDNPRYVTFHDCEKDLRKAYNEYDRHTNPCALEQITPLYSDKPGDSPRQRDLKAYYRDGLYDLYDSERAYLQKFRKEVSTYNGRFIVCPYCASKPVEDLDHYIPRVVMPEYSVHLLNLIPLCHKCNHDKHDEWLDANGHRLFFNAYFDTLPDIKAFLNVTFAITNSPDLPQITLSFNHPSAQAAGESARIVSSTIDKLHLVNLYWQQKAEDVLKNETRQILAHVKADLARHVDTNFNTAWQKEKDCISYIISILEPNEFIEHVVYTAIISSLEMGSWIASQV